MLFLLFFVIPFFTVTAFHCGRKSEGLPKDVKDSDFWLLCLIYLYTTLIVLS